MPRAIRLILAIALLATALVGPAAQSAKAPPSTPTEDEPPMICFEDPCWGNGCETDCGGGETIEPCDHVPCTFDPCDHVDCDLDPCDLLPCNLCGDLDCPRPREAAIGGVPACLDPRGCGYDEDENRICSPTDPGWIHDTDDDGEVDCVDDDDDGDMLSDKYEDTYDGYQRSESDSDGDGTPDSYSIHPTDGLPKWTVSALDYDGATACDGGHSRPDPWIPFFELQVVDTWTATIEAPPGWQKDNHVHDRGAGVVADLILNTRNGSRMVNGDVSLPVDIRNFGTTENGKAPRLQVSMRLKDHDGHAGGGEELMDLSEAADEEVGTFTANLMGRSQEPDSSGEPDDSRCWGMLRFRFADNVAKIWVCAAFHHHKYPDELIRTDTDLECPE